ncbi:MAG: hypothetical protein ACOCZM_01350 [Bacillota bacterium]
MRRKIIAGSLALLMLVVSVGFVSHGRVVARGNRGRPDDRWYRDMVSFLEILREPYSYDFEPGRGNPLGRRLSQQSSALLTREIESIILSSDVSRPDGFVSISNSNFDRVQRYWDVDRLVHYQTPVRQQLARRRGRVYRIYNDLGIVDYLNNISPLFDMVIEPLDRGDLQRAYRNAGRVKEVLPLVVILDAPEAGDLERPLNQGLRVYEEVLNKLRLVLERDLSRDDRDERDDDRDDDSRPGDGRNPEPEVLEYKFEDGLEGWSDDDRFNEGIFGELEWTEQYDGSIRIREWGSANHTGFYKVFDNLREDTEIKVDYISTMLDADRAGPGIVIHPPDGETRILDRDSEDGEPDGVLSAVLDRDYSPGTIIEIRNFSGNGESVVYITDVRLEIPARGR